MANESVAHDSALSSDEQEFLRLWRLLEADAKGQVIHAMASIFAKGERAHG